MKRIILLFACILFFGFIIDASASVVTIEGKSVLIPDKPERTKELSLQATLKKAIEIYVVGLITRPTADANYEKLYTTIYTPYSDFITKYEIVSERQDGQFQYTNAKVEIDDAKVQGQLAALGIQPGVGEKPRIAVIVSEQNIDGEWVSSYYYSIYHGGGEVAVGEANFNICEGKINNILSSAGYPLIDLTLDPTEVKSAFKFSGIFDRYSQNMNNMPPEQASKLMRALDDEVQIVISCKALAKNAGRKTAHFNSISANVACRASDISKKRIVASVQTNATVPHIDAITGGNEALSKACEEAAAQLAEKMNR